jgi:hypothetical protein
MQGFDDREPRGSPSRHEPTDRSNSGGEDDREQQYLRADGRRYAERSGCRRARRTPDDTRASDNTPSEWESPAEGRDYKE